MSELPDLFCRYLEELSGLDVDLETDIPQWESEDSWRSLCQVLAVDATQDRGAVKIQMRVDNGEGRARRLYAALCAMDRAFHHVNPHAKCTGPAPDALVPLAVFVAVNDRLTAEGGPGALVPRDPAAPSPECDDPFIELFHNVQRVPRGNRSSS